MIQIQNLSKEFPYQTALKEINLTLPAGEMIGIVGPDGSGKTTLLRMVAGLLKPTTGTVSVLGADTIRDSEQIHAFSGYMPQRFGLYEDLTVEQNLNLYANLRGLEPGKKEETFKQLFQFTQLGKFANYLVKTLSGGMKQKLGLACALVQKPKLLILDEPSVGVDPISRRELWSMVQSLLKEGVSILWSTTYLNEAEECQTIVLLNEGKLLYVGKPSELAKGKTLEEAFYDLLASKEGNGFAQAAPITPAMSGDAIVATNLVKRFGSFTAVDRVSFSVHRGEIFGFLGPNGAGKSTTFKMLCGLLKPTEGSATVNGLDVQKVPAAARTHIGYMAQKFSLYENLTVQQNLEFFAGIYPTQGKINEKLAFFELEPFKARNAEELPLGVKQKLSLAAAIMHWPEVLFLDEATSGMDPVARKEFWSQMKELAQKGKTILISTHFMDEAEYCDRIALINHGTIIYLGSPAELKRETGSATLEEAFIKRMSAKVDGTP